MRSIVLVVAAAALSACATVQTVPDKRPMTAAALEKIGPVPVVVVENVNGVEKSWFFQSSQGAAASYGLIGALTAAAVDAVANAKPSHRAAKVADKIAEFVPAEGLSDSLAAAFAAQQQVVPAVTSNEAVVVEAAAPAAVPAVTSPTPPTIHFASVSKALRLGAKDKPADRTVDVVTQYLLSEDAAALRVTATASFSDPAIPYLPPYAFEKSAPKSHKGGPVYKNVFVYESDAYPLPLLTEALKGELVAAIENDYRDESGNLPAEGEAFEKMTSEIEDARDNSLSKMEASLFLARNWIDGDGAALRREIEKAHSFIAKYVGADINSTAVPNAAGVDELVEEFPDGRTVRIVGSGVAAGSYVSAPGRASQSLVSYGNTSKIADVNQKRESELRKAAKSPQPKR